MEFDEEFEWEFCHIIGKDILGGCQVEFCDGLESCPYFKPEYDRFEDCVEDSL